jgi:hypothetical protein
VGLAQTGDGSHVVATQGTWIELNRITDTGPRSVVVVSDATSVRLRHRRRRTSVSFASFAPAAVDAARGTPILLTAVVDGPAVTVSSLGTL